MGKNAAGPELERLLADIGRELAQAGVSMDVLRAQAAGRAALDAEGGFALLAARFDEQAAAWFFEFLRGVETAPVQAAVSGAQLPLPEDLRGVVEEVVRGLALTAEETTALRDGLLRTGQETPAPAGQDKPATAAELEQAEVALQKQQEAALAEVQALSGQPPEAAVAPAQAPESKAPVPDAGAVDKAAAELEKALEQALNELRAVSGPQG